MNPVLWLLIFIGATFVWLAISFIFIPLGKLINRKIKKFSDIVNYEEKDEEKEE